MSDEQLDLSEAEWVLIRGALAIAERNDGPWAQFNRPEILQLQKRLRSGNV